MMNLYSVKAWFQNIRSIFTRKIGWSAFVIILITVAVFWTNMNNNLWKSKNGVLLPDVVVYYSYLPAAIIHHDLNFNFVAKDLQTYAGLIYLPRTPDGKPYQKMTMGLAMLYSPFFLLGHLTAYINGDEMSGYSRPYMFWLLFSSMVYLFFGLIILRKVLLRYFTDKLTAFVLLTVVVGTNLFYYATLEAAMSHSYNFFLFSAFIFCTIRWYEQASVKNSLLTGLVFGFIVLIRPTNGLIVLFFLLYNISSFNQLTRRFNYFLQNWGQILIIVLMTFLVLVPQLIFWKTVTGNWILYTYGKEGFFFNNPQIYRGLFSYRKGWLLYTPVMVFGLAGIYFLRKRVASFFVPVLIFTIINIYVIYSWWDWSYGGSFGSRPMIDSYPLMAVALAALISTVSKGRKWLGIGLHFVIVMLILFNIFQILQTKYATIHFAEMSKKAYWHSFGKLKADAEFYDKLEPMDYKQLVQGKYVIKPKLKITISDRAINDFETLKEGQPYYISPDSCYQFLDFESRSDIQARNGTYSALLYGEKSFCSGVDFFVKPKQRYRISVWKKPATAHASLVMTANNAEEFYLPQEKIEETDVAGWGKISFEVTIPDNVNSMYRVYVWNKVQDSVFFDDLLIERLH